MSYLFDRRHPRPLLEVAFILLVGLVVPFVANLILNFFFGQP